MSKADRFFSISEAAQKLGISISTLRRWEREGKISIGRTPGGQRLFSEEDLKLLSSPIKTKVNKRDSNFQIPSVKVHSRILALTTLLIIAILANFYLLSLTSIPHQAVLGVETFVAPVLEESSPIGSLLGRIGSFFRNNPVSSFVLTVIPKTIEQNNTTQTIVQKVNLPDNLKLNTLTSSDISSNSIEAGVGITAYKLNVQNNSTIGGSETITNNLTVGGTLNGNTFSSSSLVFSGSSPSIYPTTSNSQISLNASGTGAINIGNSSKGDIYLGGGNTSGVNCIVTNSNGSFACTSDITTNGTLHANGGSLGTSQTTFNLINDTATTISFAGAATSLSIGATTGTTTVNNALTVTGTLTGNTFSSSNATITGGTINNTSIGATTTSTGAFTTLTTSSTINSNSFTSTALTFAGSSPNISASTTNTPLTINANGIGTITLGSTSTGNVQFFSSSNNITSAGALTTAGAASLATGLSTGMLTLGQNPSTVGEIRIPNNAFIWSRNAANTGNVQLIGVNGSDNILLPNQVQLSSNLIFGTDNNNDIGASGANRPRDLYLGRSIGIGTPASGTPGEISLIRNDNAVDIANIINSSSGVVSINKNLSVLGGIFANSSYSPSSASLTVGFNTMTLLSQGNTTAGSGSI